MNSPTVYVIDDDLGIRTSLTYLIRSVGIPVKTFEDPEGFLSSFMPDQPGCLVLDIRIPKMSGLELQQKLIGCKSSLPIIVLTGYGDVPTAVQALKAGAFDFIEKPFQNQRLLDTIQEALRHSVQVNEQLARRTKVEMLLATLNCGERAVLDRMMNGSGYKSIAKVLNISYKTVQARRAQIMKKIGVDDLAGLMHVVLMANQAIGAA